MHESSKVNVQNATKIIDSAMENLPKSKHPNNVVAIAALGATGMYATSLINELGRIADALEGKTEPVNLPPLKGMSDEANMAWAEYRNDYGVDPTDANHRAFHAGFKAGQSDLIAQTDAMQDEIDELSDEIEKLSVDYTLEHESVEGLVDELGGAESRIRQLKSELENQTARAEAAEEMMSYCNMDAIDQSSMRSNLRRDIESLLEDGKDRPRVFTADELKRILVKDRGREFDARVRKAKRENRDRA